MNPTRRDSLVVFFISEVILKLVDHLHRLGSSRHCLVGVAVWMFFKKGIYDCERKLQAL
jgi:hypothetical protein